jgi:DNA-binding MarR family transcriptional regulator
MGQRICGVVYRVPEVANDGCVARTVNDHVGANPPHSAISPNLPARYHFPMSSPDAVTAARAVVVLYRHLEQATRAADISMAQYRLLLFLKDGPQQAGVLAKVSALSKATISLAINGVRERGWVSTASNKDGRTTVVSLTAKGRKKVAAFEENLAIAIGEALRPQDLKGLARAVDAAAAEVKKNKKTWLESAGED